MSRDDMFLEAEIVNDLIYIDAVSPHPLEYIEAKIRAAIKVECDRQHVGEDRQQMLFDAYSDLQMGNDFKLITEVLLYLAKWIEPSNGGKYRQTPITIGGVERGVPAQNIGRAMKNWIDYFNQFEKGNTWSYMWMCEADRCIKEFLDIHPFSDGNGRTAWLLRVWLLNQWDDPQPLPDYYNES